MNGIKARLKKVAFLTLVATGVATAALAAWFVLGLVEGEGTTKTGKTTPSNVGVGVTFNPTEGLMPGTEGEAMMLTVENSTATAFTVHSLLLTITDTNEAGGCAASNFTIAGYSGAPETARWTGGGASGTELTANTAVNIPASSNTPLWTEGHAAKLQLAAAAPQACENASVKVKVKRTN